MAVLAERTGSNTDNFYKRLLITLGLILAVLLSSIGVVYVSHLNRHAFSAYQAALQERDRLDTEWGQLLLEQSALASHARVEQIARKRLGMEVPGADDIILVRP